jgi:hypothetical protein
MESEVLTLLFQRYLMKMSYLYPGIKLGMGDTGYFFTLEI